MVAQANAHTPGPWKTTSHFIDTVEPRAYRSIDDSGDHHSIAKTFGPNHAANAHLIAAAPELKEALKNLKADVRGILSLELRELRSLVGNTNLAVLFQRVEEAEAALAKAEGRP